jgi:hypothetical protein
MVHGSPVQSFRPDARITSIAAQDRWVRQRATEEAALLFAQHAGGAASLVAKDLRTLSQAPDERRYSRLVIVELERLDRAARREEAQTRRPSLLRRIAARLGGVLELT